MADRASRKTPPQTTPAHASAGSRILHVPGWTYSEDFCGYLLQPVSPVNPAEICIQTQGRALTVSLGGNALSGMKYYRGSGVPLKMDAALHHRFLLPKEVNAKEGKAVWCLDTLTVRFPRADLKAPANTVPLIELDDAPAPVIVIPIDLGSPVTPILQPKAKTYEPKMQRETTITIEAGLLRATTTMEAQRYVFRGVAYLPFPFAAVLAQTTEKNLRDWIKKNVKFNGQSIRTQREPATGKLYVSEESVRSMAQRFVKWPSNEPAGPINIGQTDDQSGYLGLPAAARTIGVDHHTVWRWITRGTMPIDSAINIIKCTTSDHYYIREKDIYELKAFVPRGGLRPGRRPQPTP